MMRVKLSFALILSMLVLSISASQAENEKDLHNPSPNSPLVGKPEHKHSGQANNRAPHDGRGTENNPLVIKGIPAPKDPQEAQEDHRDKEIKTSLDQQLNILTGWQTGFAGMMFIATAVQVFLFWWQLAIMRETLNASKTAADAAANTANYLINIERAYVFVKICESTINSETWDASAKIWLVNYGKTPAIIRIIRGWIKFLDAVPNELPKPTEAEDLWKDGVVLAPGPDPQVIITAGPTRTKFNQSQFDSISGTRTFYCMGVVEYQDVFGKNWETRFCWHYSPSSEHHAKFDFTRDSAINRRT
jgi:hypothetical protein